MEKKFPIGGQAVLEGVMMRGKAAVGIAVRTPSGDIAVRRQALSSWGERWPVFKLPLLRGLASLLESMLLGMNSLMDSANLAGEEEEKLSNTEMGFTVALSLVVGTLLFIALPAVLTRYLKAVIENNIVLNALEFGIRIALFVGYILAISRLKEVQRLFQYHGAEHKAVSAYEAGLPLTIDNTRTQTTLHPRCGTSFILVVFTVSMFLFAFVPNTSLWYRVATRIALMPLVAGISYEIIRLAGRSHSPLVRLIVYPGMLMQKLTTREPDDRQQEVAIAALQLVLDKEA